MGRPERVGGLTKPMRCIDGAEGLPYKPPQSNDILPNGSLRPGWWFFIGILGQ
jgi:hypothetical protein